MAKPHGVNTSLANGTLTCCAPGANDALFQMYQTSKALKEHMVAAGCGWSMNECILTAGQATADNLPAQLAQIQYIMRVPTLEMAQRITGVLDQNAVAASSISHCSWRRDWVSKSRHGLANHVLAQATYDNLCLVGAPKFNQGAARGTAREIQRNLGLEPMDEPYLGETEKLISPQQAEIELRRELPEWQQHFTSDDYTGYRCENGKSFGASRGRGPDDQRFAGNDAARCCTGSDIDGSARVNTCRFCRNGHFVR